MTRRMREPARMLPVAATYDVVVVGGGIAGVAAAVAAARCRASVALVEKTCALGGLATLANVVEYLPLCDGRGHQVVGGLGEELLRLSIRDGYDRVPACWQRGGNRDERLQQRYRVRFNPASLMLELEALTIRHGVTLYYDTRFCDVVRKRDRVQAVILENKDGRSAVACRTVVDASGDADVCACCGERTASLATNVQAGWFFYSQGQEVKLHPLSQPFDAYGRAMPGAGPGYAGDRGADVTQQLVDTRELIRRRLRLLQRRAGEASVLPLILPLLPSFRMTRRLVGAVELSEADQGQRFTDTVGLTGDWRQSGPIYAIPLRALTACRTDNLITAGRCISASTAWDVTRAIPTCAVTGQAAGTAAALAARARTPSFARLEVDALQGLLRQGHARLTYPPEPRAS